MLVELHIHGHLYRQWQFDFADYREPFCQVGYDEKQKLWAQIIEQCKNEVDPIIRSNPYEFFIMVPARIQPADVDPEEQEQLLNHIIDKQNSSL